MSTFYPLRFSRFEFQKTLILFAFLFFPLLNSIAQTKTRQQEKTELIGKAISYALVQRQNLPTYSMVKDKKTIYVFSKMPSLSYPDSASDILTEEMLPKLEGIKLKLVSEMDLIKQPLKNKDMFYLEIGKIDILTPEAAVVDISAKWILGKKSRQGGLGHRGAGGYSLIFTRQNGGWSEGREIRNWDN